MFFRNKECCTEKMKMKRITENRIAFFQNKKKMLHEQKKEMQNNSRDLKDIEENKYKNKSLIIFMSSTVKYDH
jgi:hypothetical protein